MNRIAIILGVCFLITFALLGKVTSNVQDGQYAEKYRNGTPAQLFGLFQIYVQNTSEAYSDTHNNPESLMLTGLNI